MELRWDSELVVVDYFLEIQETVKAINLVSTSSLKSRKKPKLLGGPSSIEMPDFLPLEVRFMLLGVDFWSLGVDFRH